MPTRELTMAINDHVLVADPVTEWIPEFLDSRIPSVMLTAAVQVGPNPPIFPAPGGRATTLAVQMDARVAIELYEKLGHLIRSMGWPTSTKDLPRA